MPMELFNLLFAGQAQSWLQAALLVCLFWVALIALILVGVFRLGGVMRRSSR